MTDLTDGVPARVPGYLIPNPDAPRAAHIDLGLTGDACGLAVGHANGYRMVRSRNPRTNESEVEKEDGGC